MQRTANYEWNKSDVLGAGAFGRVMKVRFFSTFPACSFLYDTKMCQIHQKTYKYCVVKFDIKIGCNK